MHSMSLRNGRDVLIKSVSSAYSTSSGKAASSGGRVGRRDLGSRRAASRKTVNRTGLRLSPCGVPIVVANAMQPPVDRRGWSEVSASRVSNHPQFRFIKKCLQSI